MIESLYIAETGMKSQQQMIDVISHNLANTATPGFKRGQVNFSELVGVRAEAASPMEAPRLHGVVDSGLSQDFAMGGLKQTGNLFDIAIEGEAFLGVVREDGSMGLTRSGRLGVDAEGYLTAANGRRLEDNIQIPPGNVRMTITSSGKVLVKDQDSADLYEVGALTLYRVPNMQGLENLGDGVYAATNDSGDLYPLDLSERGRILQGFMELSNVDMNREMVDLMLAQRGYQINARIVQASDQILETINNLRR